MPASRSPGWHHWTPRCPWGRILPRDSQVDLQGSGLILAAAILITFAGCARDPKPGTPEAAALGDQYMHSMSDTLAHAQTFTFDTDEHLQVLTPSGEKREMAITRKVTVRRPNAVAFELHGKSEGAPEVVAYYDGKTATLSNTKSGIWAQTAVPGTLDEMLDYVGSQYGLPVPIGDVMYASPYDAYLGKNSKGGFVGRETIDGVSYAVVDYADDFVGVKLWIPSKGPALPRRLEITYKKAPMPLESKVDFTNWKLDVPVTDAMFAFQAPAGRAPIDFSDFVAALYGGTAPSPATSGGSAPGTPAAR